MRINTEQKSLDIEARDINYILPAYIRSYLFYASNEDPEKITFPMFRSVTHPLKPDVQVPIEWVPEDSPVATTIAQDASNIPEATEAEIAAKDEKDEEIKWLRAEVEGLKSALPRGVAASETIATEKELAPAPEDLTRQQEEANITEMSSEGAIVSPAKAAFSAEEPTPTVPDREPRKPEVVIPPGSPLGEKPRDVTDQRRIAKDLASQPEVDESKEIEVGKTEDGNIEAKPDDSS